MKTFIKPIAAGLAGLMVFGFSAASANSKSDHRADNNDRRSQAVNTNSGVKKDRNNRANSQKSSGVSLSIRVSTGNNNAYRQRANTSHRAYYGQNNKYRSRIIRQETYSTKYRARILLTEEVRRGRKGKNRLVCTVSARGPEQGYVSKRRLNRIADRDCSRRARINVLA